MTTDEKLQLIKLRSPLNPSADDAAIDAYVAAVIEGASPAALEKLACDTACSELIARLRERPDVDHASLDAMLTVIEVMEA